VKQVIFVIYHMDEYHLMLIQQFVDVHNRVMDDH
jgi:hypothetical protein